MLFDLPASGSARYLEFRRDDFKTQVILTPEGNMVSRMVSPETPRRLWRVQFGVVLAATMLRDLNDRWTLAVDMPIPYQPHDADLVKVGIASPALTRTLRKWLDIAKETGRIEE